MDAYAFFFTVSSIPNNDNKNVSNKIMQFIVASSFFFLNL